MSGASVRTRITIAVAFLTGLALAGAGLVVYVLESDHIDQAVVEQVDQELGEFAALQGGDDPQTGRPFTDLRDLIQLFLERNVPDDDELLLGYWNGRPQKLSATRYAKEFADQPELLRVIEERLTSGGTERLEVQPWGDVVVTVQPVRDEDTTGAFVIANFLDDEHAELNRVMQTYAIVALLSLLVITAAAFWLAGRLLSPVRTLTSTAEEISATDLSRRIPERGNDDLTALTATFNRMLDRLEGAFTGQRQFLDDAGHELKTPLTILQGHLELVDPRDSEDVAATRVLLLDEVDRMSRLVNDLIMLAKTDRPDFLRPTDVDLGPFTETVLDKCRALGDRAWTLDARAEVQAHVDEHRVSQALIQLAENAVKHTRPGDEIGVGSSIDRHGVRLWVRDTGRGVRAEHKDVIFQRFGRGEVREGDEGFGLGLSLVSAIAAAHGGTVDVEDVVPHGAKFVLTLPVTQVRRTEEPWHAS